MKIPHTVRTFFLLFVIIVTLAACSTPPQLTPPTQKLIPEFAFSLETNGQSDIYIGNADGAIVKQLTDDPGYDFAPIFSPDGSKIVFCSNRSGEHHLYVMIVDGTSQTLLTDQLDNCPTLPDRPIVWSPDSQWIAFASPSIVQRVDIYIIKSDGSKTINLTDSPSFYGAFLWDPDSKSLLFLEARGEPDIYRIDIASKKISRLMDKPVWAAPIEYSPDGKQLLVMNGPKQAVSVISFSQGNPVITKLSSGDVIDTYPHWSKDGQRILFMRQEGQNQDIYWMNGDGSGLVNLTEGSGVLNAWPTLSPDGQKIIYLTNHDYQWDMMIMNADGSGKTKVTEIFGSSGLISWRP